MLLIWQVQMLPTVQVNFARQVKSYFVFKRQEGSFDIAHSMIHKCTQTLIGKPKTVNKFRSGERFIEVNNNSQAVNLKTFTHFANIAVCITPHRTLYTSRGVILESDLLDITEALIKNNLKE